MPMPWDLGLNTCGPVDDEHLATLIDAGFRYVYLNGTALDPETLDECHAAMRRHACDITPWSIHFPIIFGGWDMDEDAVAARLRSLIEQGAPYGVKHATLHLPCYWQLCGGQVDVARVEAHRARVRRVLECGAEKAHEYGIGLTVENCGQHESVEPEGYCVVSAADLRAFVSSLNSDRVGVCLDSGHAMLGYQNPADMIRELGDLLHETHLNDNFGVLRGRKAMECDYHRPPGIGKIDWLDVMDALDETEYPNPVVFEEGMVQVGGDTFEYLARATHDNWRAFERARAKRDGQDPAALPRRTGVET